MSSIITHELFSNRINKIYEDRILIKTQYISYHDKISVQCMACNYEWDVLPSELCRNKGGCRKCSNVKRTMTDDQFIIGLNRVHGVAITANEKYIKSSIKIEFKCNVCSNIWKAVPRQILSGKGCKTCSMKRVHKSHKNYDFLSKLRAKVKILFDDDVTIHDDQQWISNFTPIKVSCNECNITYMAKPSSLSRGYKCCPECSARGSLGEVKIKKILDANYIDYKEQFTFPDLIGSGGRKLRFDFAIMSRDGALSHLIEFDGSQHTEMVLYFGGDKGLAMRKLHDSLKDKYCIDNGLKLIRIKHTMLRFLSQSNLLYSNYSVIPIEYALKVIAKSKVEAARLAKVKTTKAEKERKLLAKLKAQYEPDKI